MNKFLFVLLFILGTLLIVQVVNATISETFPLSQAYGTPIIRNVELQKNDRLVGSFTITNIPWWSNSFVGVEGYACSVTILDPNNNVILEYTNKIGDSSWSLHNRIWCWFCILSTVRTWKPYSNSQLQCSRIFLVWIIVFWKSAIMVDSHNNCVHSCHRNRSGCLLDI
jgi:hypothetical protein